MIDKSRELGDIRIRRITCWRYRKYMKEELFIINQNYLPKKKLRGAERHLRRLEQKAKAFTVVNGSDDWFDYWHYHVDQKNMSSRKWKYRKKHLEAAFQIFHRLIEETKILGKPFQLWVMINQRVGYDDAVFLHTPNPNHDHFPCKIENLDWGDETLADSFAIHFEPYPIRVGYSYNTENKQNIYYIYSPEVGVPLE